MKLKLLTHDDISYDYDGKDGKKIKAIDCYGISAYPSDFALSNGIYVENLCSPYWINSNIKKNYVNAVNSKNGYTNFNRMDKYVGIRPKMNYSELYGTIPYDELCRDVYETKSFEYIGHAVDKNMQEQLNSLALDGELLKTGKKYTTGVDYENGELDFTTVDECYYNGNKYVLLDTKSLCLLSNSQVYTPGDYHWHLIEPVSLIVSVSDNAVIFKKIILSGIPFSFESCKSVESSFIQEFLDERLSSELVSSRTITNEIFMLPEEKNTEKKLVKVQQ